MKSEEIKKGLKEIKSFIIDELKNEIRVGENTKEEIV